MIVVADSSPLRYLILIEHAQVLPALYGRVLIPPAVASELNRQRMTAFTSATEEFGTRVTYELIAATQSRTH